MRRMDGRFDMRGCLYLVTDQRGMRGRSLIDVVLAAVQGGVTCVQLRDKHLETADLVALACVLKERLSPLGVPLFINDRIDVALACGADGVHVGQLDMPVEKARFILPSHVLLGLSVSTLEEAMRAPVQSVDYLGVGPIFTTLTKTDALPPMGLEGLRQVRSHVDVPLIAIGGISADNARSVMDAGADGLAVASALCGVEDPYVAAQALKRICQ